MKDKGGHQDCLLLLLILTWELRYLSKKMGVNRKRGASFEDCSAWEGASYLPWRRKDLPVGLGVGGDYAD